MRVKISANLEMFRYVMDVIQCSQNATEFNVADILWIRHTILKICAKPKICVLSISKLVAEHGNCSNARKYSFDVLSITLHSPIYWNQNKPFNLHFFHSFYLKLSATRKPVSECLVLLKSHWLQNIVHRCFVFTFRNSFTFFRILITALIIG